MLARQGVYLEGEVPSCISKRRVYSAQVLYHNETTKNTPRLRRLGCFVPGAAGTRAGVCGRHGGIIA